LLLSTNGAILLHERRFFLSLARVVWAFSLFFLTLVLPFVVQDESYRYVMPNHMLLHIAEAMPSTVPALLACCNPVPPLVRINADNLLHIIKNVITAASAEGPFLVLRCGCDTGA